MEKKEEIRFDNEMKLIMNKCSDFIKSEGISVITLDILMYIITSEYMAGRGKLEEINKLLKMKLGDDKTKKEFLLAFRHIIDETSPKISTSIKKLVESSDVYPVSQELVEFFEEIMSLRSFITKMTGAKPDNVLGDGISSFEIYMSYLKGTNGSEVRMMLDSYGINRESVASVILGDDFMEGAMDEGLISALTDMAEESLRSKFSSKDSTSTKRSKKDSSSDSESSSSSSDGVSDDDFEKAGYAAPISGKKVDPNSKTPSLDQFAIDMTLSAKEGKFDPVVGRDNEISQIIEILCCRKKNNAILLGDPGTGKTAIVELLSLKISEGDVPSELKSKRIFSLDLNALVAGCIYRGQYEERLQNIIKEVTENKDIIVFIDEIHNLLGNGSSSGSGDGANILKPYLARGEFQCLGSTTTDEFRKLIEKDGALKRRFQPVFIEEPNEEQTLSILRGLSKEYGKFHGVRYGKDALEKCVEWSGKYITDRFFPDKAIGLLDMASSYAKLTRPSEMSSELDKLISEKTKLEDKITLSVKDSDGDIDALESAAELLEKHKELEDLISGMTGIKSKTPKDKLTEVTVEDISNTVSKLSGVPVDKILSSDSTKVKQMKEELKKKVIGQDKAVQELTVALQRNILGLRDPKKPIASFLLVGPTGVGKTLISKVLASEFFGSEKSLVSIACSEYMQDWAESKLLGSAPGYVGFSDSEPRLYILKRKPYVVLLIDEIEKSSSNLYNIWLNMLEEGEITLSTGEKVSCRNTIIIFTGNVGTKSLELKGDGIGFGSVSEEEKKKRDEATVMKEVQKEFRPEFLNRLTKIIVFNPLGKDELNKIFDIEFGKLKARYKESAGYRLTVTKEVKNLIISKCEPKYGARSLTRLLTEYIDNNVCQALLDEDTDGKKKVSISLVDGNINVQFS